MKVKVIALRNHYWAGESRNEGQVYEADTQDPRFDALLLIGHARRLGDVEQLVAGTVEPSKAEYQRRDMRARK